LSASTSTPNDPRLLFTGPSPFGGHRYALAAMCLRRYGLDYEDNPLPTRDANGNLIAFVREAEDADPEASAWELIRGTMVHTGLAHFYARRRAQQRKDGATLDLLYEPVEAMRALHEQERDRAHLGDRESWDNALIVGERVMLDYAKRYAFEKARVEIVEEVFSLELGDNKAPYTFRLDLGIRDSAGKVWMVDHKTTTRLRPDHGWSYGISVQFQAYAVGGRAIYGEDYGGVMANMIECPEPDDPKPVTTFDRPRMPGVAGFLTGFPARISDIYGRLVALVQSGLPPALWPKNPGVHSCRSYGRVCPYYDRCSTSPD
jgi:hypothetical protein